MNSVRLLRRSASSRAGLTDRSDYEGTTNYAAECSVREQLCCFFCGFWNTALCGQAVQPGKMHICELEGIFYYTRYYRIGGSDQ